jgi:hypothetical protein
MRELAKVPAGCRYIEAPNYPRIQQLLRENTPFYQIQRPEDEGIS